MSIWIRNAILGCGLMLLSGCAGFELETDYVLDPALHAQVIDQTSDQFPEIDPLYLDDGIKRWLEDNVGTRSRSNENVVSVLQNLLYGEDHLDIQYSDEKTHTAVELFHARRGNCLSVMNLYVAMARHVGLDASFQTVKVKPSWDRRGDLLVVSQHINATGRLRARRHYVVDFTPEISLQRMTEDVVSDADARGLYFNNLGVEALIAGETGQALVYFKNALFINPRDSYAWNNLGTTFNRLGDDKLAEFSYHYAFEIDNTSATAVNNLVKFYRARGQDALSRRYELVIDRFNQRNPYFQYALGKRAYEQGNFESARTYFRRAIRLKDYDPDFHLALALAYLQLGEVDRAQDARDEAEIVLAASDEIYEPSSSRLRIIDRGSILRNSSPGLSIILQSGVLVEPER